MNVKQKNLLHQQSPSTFITNKNMESERRILKEVKYGFDILQEYPYSVKRNGCLFPWKEKYRDLRTGMRERANGNVIFVALIGTAPTTPFSSSPFTSNVTVLFAHVGKNVLIRKSRNSFICNFSKYLY